MLADNFVESVFGDEEAQRGAASWIDEFVIFVERFGAKFGVGDFDFGFGAEADFGARFGGGLKGVNRGVAALHLREGIGNEENGFRFNGFADVFGEDAHGGFAFVERGAITVAIKHPAAGGKEEERNDGEGRDEEDRLGFVAVAAHGRRQK